MRALLYSCVLSLVSLSLFGQEDVEANRKRIRAAFETTRDSDRRLGNYLFHRHTIRKEFDSDGKLKTQTDMKFRRDPWDEFAVNRMVEKDGRPLTADEQKKQEEALRKRVLEMRKEGTASANKRQEEEEAFIAEMPDALDFRKAGTDTYEGRPVEVFAFEPRKGYAPKNMRAKVFEKVRGKLWLDPKDSEIVKIDAEIFDTVNVGFGLVGRIEKGTHFEIERRPTDAGHWLMSWQRIRFDVRVMLVKPLRREVETRYSNFAPRTNIKPSTAKAFSAL